MLARLVMIQSVAILLALALAGRTALAAVFTGHAQGAAAGAWEIVIFGAIVGLWAAVMAGFATYLQLSSHLTSFRQDTNTAASTTLRQSQQLIRTQDGIIFALAKLADSRDPETGDHLERIAFYSRTLAAAAAHDPRFEKEITPSFVRLIGLTAALHDIGKVGVRDAVLQKPGPLTVAERVEMQQHTLIARKCLRELRERLGSSPLLDMAEEIAVAHHERWDGSGYPLGLSGAGIPLAARIVAIADVYDALASTRVYKAAMPHAVCMAEIEAAAGSHFDPSLVDVWRSVASEFAAFRAHSEQRAQDESAELATSAFRAAPKSSLTATPARAAIPASTLATSKQE